MVSLSQRVIRIMVTNVVVVVVSGVGVCERVVCTLCEGRKLKGRRQTIAVLEDGVHDMRAKN